MEPTNSQNSENSEKIDEKSVQYVYEQGNVYSDAPMQYEPIYAYEDDYHGISQEIYHEEIVGEEEYVDSLPSTSSAPPPPPNTNKHRLIKNEGRLPYPASTVLLTNQSLSGEKATFLAKSGKRRVEETKKAIPINQHGSELNRNLPGMSNMFSVLRESALKKTEESLRLEDVKIEENKGREASEEPEEDVNPPETPPALERLGDSEPIFDQWPMYSTRAIDYKEACELFIGILEIDDEKVCKSLPMQFKQEGTFLVDLRLIRDVFNDDNGGWEVPSGKCRFYKEMEDQGNMVRVDNGKGRLKEWCKEYTYKIILKKYENKTTRGADDGRGQFQKKIYTGYKGATRLPFAIITYSWSDGRPWIFVPPLDPKTVHRKPNWEKKSYDKVNMTSMPQMVSAFYEGFNIYSHCIVSFDEAAAIMLGATLVDANKLCSSVPLGYRQNGTFVIDLKKMGYCLLELRRDDNGLWTKPSGFSRFYKLAENGDALRVDKAGKLPAGVDFDVKISSKRYENTQVEKKFVRKIYTAKGKTSDTFPGSPEYAVIVYYWKGEPIQFEPIYKQNAVRTDAKEYARYQQMEEEEQEFVETSGPPMQILGAEEEMIEKNIQPPTLKRARFSNEQSENLLDLKMTLIRRELENQDRFSALLDRADGMLSRMEQRFGVEPVFQNVVQQWEPHHHVEEVQQIIEEEMNQFIEQLESLKTTFAALPVDCLIDAIEKLDQTVEQLSQSVVFVEEEEQQMEHLVDVGKGFVHDYLNPTDDFSIPATSSDDFNSPEVLASQFQMTSSPSNPSQVFCFTCGQSFNNRKGLWRHGIATKHKTREFKYSERRSGDVPSLPTSSGIQNSSEFGILEPFTVTKLEGTFLENSEEEKFVCFECQKSFANRKALYRHGQQTNHVLRLKRTVKVKGGIYACPECSYSTDSLANRRLHFKRNHNKSR
ncbi:hypothetical protein L5515_009706 [Caenorhabditis briggsae]|uniref:C2H2-type domain-containing protein n=1 Tax=Caenorhabditis briggsae TaxID=6238 RepID=A0AAE9JND9_CAEBR|nr:hypothetical protein L5515_009706 [Caenorhabditis briggsae]